MNMIKHLMSLIKCALFCVILLPASITFAKGLSVASLNPVLSDLARQVGGERVRVIELMKAGENPHAFTPRPEQLRAAQDAQIILASGKGLETYLSDLRGNLSSGQQLLEVGKSIPSLTADHETACTGCAGHNHDHTSIDPHWWHSIRNLQRATRVIAAAFSELAPDDKTFFQTRSRDYCKHLEELNRWAKREIHKIPRSARILTTAHASFAYFCNDFGFSAVSIQGLSSETTPDPKQMTSVIKTIRQKNITALFPEKSVNSELIESIMRETGVKAGGYLLAAGPEPENPTCEAMIRHNVETIVKALAPGKE